MTVTESESDWGSLYSYVPESDETEKDYRMNCGTGSEYDDFDIWDHREDIADGYLRQFLCRVEECIHNELTSMPLDIVNIIADYSWTMPLYPIDLYYTIGINYDSDIEDHDIIYSDENIRKFYIDKMND